MFSVRVEKVIKYNENYSTIFFDSYLKSYPGQFVMVNVFGYEEIPLSLSSPNSVTVKAVGKTTKALINIPTGELLGIRGSFGKPFTPTNGKALLIAGGIGAAPLFYLHDYLKRKGVEVKVLYGARTQEELIWKSRFENVVTSTDDGSEGFKGTVFDLLKRERIEEYSKIYCCGPEALLKKLYNYFEELEILSKTEFSLERYMRCGIGVCGSCVLENGLRVCADGPVFRGDEIDF
ncbi:dihydroorotate dehydrogenase electron transfer subunit [Archaeoglobales archaeon]|nr:MAG: dihydroorotate dehydrogenase electron transfer subunit [Archaeoglobales archaeon]